jgi:hypothetical protein
MVDGGRDAIGRIGAILRLDVEPGEEARSVRRLA